ncbi:MAG: hypothetical protein R3F23_07080 [Verrucomicrobiia bacterium]
MVESFFGYTNNNGIFFPSSLPLYTLQPKEKFVGTFKTGLTPQVTASSTKTTTTVDEENNIVNQTEGITRSVGGLDIIIQKRREVFALSSINNFTLPILVASNAAGVKIIGPK